VQRRQTAWKGHATKKQYDDYVDQRERSLAMMRCLFGVVLLVLVSLPAIASASLDSFLGSVNAQARVDLPGFHATVSAQFGVPVPQVEAVLGMVATPADAFMVFQLGQMSHRPPDTVVHTYQAHKGKGWGVIAKELGIKPGSREFHALKSGDLVYGGGPSEGGGKGKGKGNGKGHKK
jgi:hypothetical protein